MRRFTVALATAVAAAGVVAPAAAAQDHDPPMPRKSALDKYSGLYHKCKDVDFCTAGRNIRRQGVKFKYVAEDDKRHHRNRHWAARPATAHDVAKKIRHLRRTTAPRYFAGAWAIPTAIVMCESQGTNAPPNSAGASGYYQIIPSTWAANGGLRFASAAYLASRPEQDIVARHIWNSGGASQWDCAAIVGIG
jgi:hypothetical protein